MKTLRLLTSGILVLAITTCATGFWVWQTVRTPVKLSSSSISVEIPRGATFDQALTLLSKAGVLPQILPLRIYLKIAGANPNVQAGTYEFASPLSPLDVVNILRPGGKADRLTVVEGWTRWDIADAMSKMPDLKLANANQAMDLMNDTSLISDLDPKAKNLEGYLFPDTYFLVGNTTPKEMIARMVARFRQVQATNFKSTTKDSSPSLHDIVTVASIIETEAKLKQERPIIASVIYNRIGKNMPLGVDSTIVYAAKLAGKWRYDGTVYQSDIDRVSPYNTRKVEGLPPGPVSSPGLASLKAALHPAKTNYLYYVRNPDRNDGAHNFYGTDTDFARGVQALRNWEQKHRTANVNVK
jgi:UPF0755 protein